MSANFRNAIVVKAKISCLGRRMTLGATSSQFMISTPLRTELAFSIGAPNLVLGFVRQEQVDEASDLEVFGSTDQHFAGARRWLRRPDHRDTLRSLRLESGEAVHVARNMLVCALEGTRDLGDDLIERVARLADAVDGVDITEPAQPDLSALPPELASLVGQFSHLSEGDDELRSELVERLDAHQRSDLLARIRPLFPAIQRYLDSIVGPWPEAAHHLSSLAELGAELASLEAQDPRRP